MQISEIVQPRSWVSLLSAPALIHTQHSARKCRKYFRRKQTLAVQPLHDRNAEIVYAIRERDEDFRMFRQIGELNNSPLGFDLAVEEGSTGAELELRFSVPRWFVVSAGIACAALIAVALLFMDWWPCLLTLAMLGLGALVSLHVAATDRRELERFLVERFGDRGEFNEEEWDEV